MKRTIIILSIACFILAMLNVYQLFLVPYEYNIPRDALFKAWTNIQEIVLFILIGGCYTALVSWLKGLSKNIDFKQNRHDYYMYLEKNEVKELKEERDEFKEKAEKLEIENNKLSAHIKGRIEHDAKVIDEKNH